MLARIGEAAADVISDMANSDQMTKRVYESYAAYQKYAMDWAKIGELGYMNARALDTDK